MGDRTVNSGTVRSIKLRALKTLFKADGLLDLAEVVAIAEGMSLLSEYAGGYELFGHRIENAALQQCLELFEAEYQAKRTERDRKSKGRHYTPVELVKPMTRLTVEPVLPEFLAKVHALPKSEQLSAMLRFSMCDPACGSGIFPAFAARKIGRAIAPFLRSDLPPQARSEAARLLASENCIYAVDLDPLAVELCKLTLWLNATLNHKLIDFPLPPLSNIRCGDALVGIVDLAQLRNGIPDGFYKKNKSLDIKEIAAAYRKQNQKERKAFKIEPGKKTLEQMHTACNVYTAACFTPLCEGSPVPTTYTLQCVLNDEIPPEQQAIVDAANELAKELRWFHWAVEFRPIMERNGFELQRR